MFFICSYDFCKDENTLNPAPLSIDSYDSIKLQNGIFSHWYVSNNGDYPYSSEEPTLWDYQTIMNANFEGNLNAGNTDYLLRNIDGIKIKRREINSFQWITLQYIPIENLLEEINFTFTDNLNKNDTQYEYGFFPVIAGIEGNPITNTIDSKFNGVFICDLDSIYKFDKGVSYGTLERVQKIGVFEPFGRKYPVIVSNGLINYDKSSFKGKIINDDFPKTKTLDRKKIVEKRNKILDFFSNKKAKILKDWNGNYWLMVIINTPKVTFDSNWGMGNNTVSFDWTEIGDPDSQKDLYRTGLIKEII